MKGAALKATVAHRVKAMRTVRIEDCVRIILYTCYRF